jgi:hypothetical protein
MYINKIDDLIDKVIDDFYMTIVLGDKKLDKIFKENNFVKFQQEINDIMGNYIKSIDLKEIRGLVTNEDNVNIIFEIIKRYIAVYLFLTIGCQKTNKNDSFINNLVEFNKNQDRYKLKINNFFNSDNNAIIIKNVNMVGNIINLLENIADKNKLEKLVQKSEYKEPVEFINILGQDYIEKNFSLESLKKNERQQLHNIIKTIILLNFYKNEDKKEVFKILEIAETQQGEYIFIDVVMPTKQYIDFSSVENILSRKEVLSGMAHEFWDYINEHENEMEEVESIDKKIMHLINSKILVPIVDDFLLYHKDTEKYDKTSNESAKIKKKEDTKIRYIVSKIDSVSDYYSDVIDKDPKLKQNIKKHFYAPLAERKAILINNNEEIKIINKLMNQGKKAIENNEYYNDLLHYRQYPYVNFKDFKDHGFSIIMDETVDVVRFVSLDKEGEYKQSKRSTLQLRVAGKDHVVNVVGFMIPTNTKPLECLRLYDVFDIKTLSDKNKNGYDLTKKFLSKAFVEGLDHESSVYWLFNLNTDHIATKTYDQTNKMTNHEQIRNIVSKLYDDLVNEIYFQYIDELDKHKELSFHESFRLLNKLEKKTLKINRNSQYYRDIEEKIFFEKYEKKEEKYDKKEDIFYGLSKDSIELPVIVTKNKSKAQKITLDISKLVDNSVLEEVEEVQGICQHNISWDHISQLRKIEPNKYSNTLYEFIQQYVIENANGDFICKSCSGLLNIKKFILDGAFDDDTQKFVTFSMPMNVSLEDIPEYAKYSNTIRNVDKIVERIATIANIPYFLGNNEIGKMRRKGVIKDTIDLVLSNNALLKKNFKERNEMSVKTYNVGHGLSNLFIFDLDDNIFVFSSKEKDYYKKLKQNNIITYIMILMILELNESQITFMTGDKKDICNFPIFEKIGGMLFENLKILKNKGGDIDNIKHYKVLCYVIYLISCMATRYKMWNHEYSEESKQKKKKFDPLVQKIIIHTIVDVLNSIIELSGRKNLQGHHYEVISTKFFQKLTTIFDSKTLLGKLKNEEDAYSVQYDRKSFVLIKSEPHHLKGKYIPTGFSDPIYSKVPPPKYFIPARTKTFQKYYHLTNVTNCETGEFHKWSVKGKFYVCDHCNENMETLKLNESLTKKINENFHFLKLAKLSKKYCMSGDTHTFTYDEKTKIYSCQKCKFKSSDNLSNKELLELEGTLLLEKNKNINQESASEHKTEEIHSKDLEYKKRFIEKLTERYNKDKKNDQYGFIQNLVSNIENVIGKDTSIQNTKLKDNVYTINHDHFGYELDKPIVITDNDNKIFYKNNHSFFKTNVIYYTSYKAGKIDVFYDSITRILLGYKESNKDYVLSKKADKKIVINYSLSNKLKLLGYSTQFINITDRYEEINNTNKSLDRDYSENSESISKEIIHNVVRNRITNLKRTIYQFQSVINRIKNNYKEVTHQEESTNVENQNQNQNPNMEKMRVEQLSEFDGLVSKYQKKLNNIILVDQNGDHKVFKHWKAVNEELFSENLEDINIKVDEETKIIDSDEINKVDISGNLILYYIITEIEKMLQFNQNKFLQTSITEFIVDFVNYVFGLFNIDFIINDFDIKRFSYILKSIGFIHDIEQKGNGLDEVSGIYEEYKDPAEEPTDEEKEQADDDEEEAQAMDMDMEFDYAKAYDDKFSDWEPNNDWNDVNIEHEHRDVREPDVFV